MLSPSEVIPFLLNEDFEVREQAAHYLNDMGDLAPPNAAEQAWAALGRFGGEMSPFGYPHSNTLLRLIGSLPPEVATAQRAIELLRTTPDKETADWLNQVLRGQSLDFLAEQRADWEQLVHVETRKAIEARLALRAAGAETLWQALVKLDQDLKASRSIQGFSERAEPVIDALLRYPDAAIAYALDVLRDPRERWWLEIWSAELVCTLRHAPAIDLLILKMRDEDGDFLREACENGLSRMDAEFLVPALVSTADADIGSDDDSFRNSIGIVLGRLKHPLSETALIRLLEKEKDPTTRAFLATALCDLCCTEGLGLLREAVLKGNYDSSVSDLKELLVTNCKFVDFAPPELPGWKKELERKAAETKARQNRLGRLGLGDSPAELMRIMASMLKDAADDPEELTIPPLPANLSNLAEITTPIRRSEPKVGRNDPCPCGSGKKYKKCCGAS